MEKLTQQTTSLVQQQQGLTLSSDNKTLWEKAVEVHKEPERFIVAQVKNEATLPSIQKLQKHDPVRLFAEYVRIFKQLATFYNDEGLMSTDFVKEVVITIQEAYYYFTLADIHFIFKKGKTNAWGKVYGKVTGGTILEWCANYDMERTALIESTQGQLSNTHKAQIPTHDGFTDLGKSIKLLTEK